MPDVAMPSFELSGIEFLLALIRGMFAAGVLVQY